MPRFTMAIIVLAAVCVGPAAAQGPDIHDTRLLSQPAISETHIAFAIASPAIIAAVGSIWLSSRGLRIWTNRRGRTYELMDEMQGEIAELQERVDFHERLLQEHQDRRRLDSE